MKVNKKKLISIIVSTIAVLVVTIFVVFTIVKCNSKVESYGDMNRITHSEILNQKGDGSNKYFVIIYSTTCNYCEQLEPFVVEYQNFVLDNKFINYKYPPIYVLNLNETKENPDIKASSDADYPNFTGTSDYKEIKFSTAPAMLEITDGVVTKLISSKLTNKPVTDIKNEFKKIME